MVNITFIYEHKIYNKAYENKILTFNEVLKDFSIKINHNINNLLFFNKGKNILRNSNKIILNDIKIMIYNINIRKKENKINYNYATCPECENLSYIKIKDNMILLNCFNNHNINLTVNEFINNQKVENNKIKCDDCGNIRTLYGKFYFCLCKKNICPLCSEFHIKSHNIIDYDKKFNICFEHNNPFISYCFNCNKNLCNQCEKNHNKHKMVLYKEIKPKKK